MEDQIVPADKKHRARVLWWGGLVLLGGAAALVILDWQIDSIFALADRDVEAAIGKARWLASLLAWVCGLSLVGVAAWFVWLGWKTHLWVQYPPPGVKVVRDTPLRTGRKARRLANLLLAIGVLLALAGVAGSWYLYTRAIATLEL